MTAIRMPHPPQGGVACPKIRACSGQVDAQTAGHTRCVPSPASALRYLHRLLKMSRNNDLHQTAPCESPSAGNDQKSRVSPESATRNPEMCRYGSACGGGLGWGHTRSFVPMSAPTPALPRKRGGGSRPSLPLAVTTSHRNML